MIRITTSLSFSVLICLVFIRCHDSNQNIPPNIILINVDDIGYGDFEPYGQQLIKTPRIKQMAQEGMLFTDFYAGSTVCGPSRASLLTSRHTGHLKSCTNGQDSLSIYFETWPQLLRENDYVTAMFGKQHKAVLDGSIVLADSPIDRGFDHFVGHLNAIDAHQQFLDGKSNGWDRRDYLFKSTASGSILKHPIDPNRFTQNEFMSHAVEFIHSQKQNPFFLYLPFTIAHAELAVPKPGDPDYSADKHEGLWEQYLDKDGNSIFPEFNYLGDDIYARQIPFKSRATFAAMISHLDRDIGRILDLLETLDLAKNTLVLLTSDNGPADEGGVDEQQIDGKLDSPFNSNGGLTGFKRSLYDGGIRVPMIAWWPGKILAGSVTNQYFAHQDIGPTVLELTESKQLTDIDGASFLPTLFGLSQTPHEYLYWEWNNKQAIRLGQFKAVRNVNDSETDHVELYNIESDKSEQIDLSNKDQYKDVLYRAKQILNSQNEGTACQFIALK